MLERVLEFSDLGSESQILYITRLLLKSSANIDDLKKACISKEYAFIRSFDGVVALLHWLDVIKVNGVVTLCHNIEKDGFLEHTCEMLFSKLASEKQLHRFINDRNLIFSDSIYVRNNLINLRFSPIRNLLIKFGLLDKDNLVAHQYIVKKDYQQWFVDTAVPLIETSQIKINKLSRFKKNQEKLEEMGAAAEAFVLSYERRKRALHANRQNIQIISDLEMGAGFDIKSYLSDKSVLLDKFIEVKSFLGPPHFHWSKNEVDVAKNKQDSYFLYLVDYDRINDIEYQPIIIKNPYKHVFLNDSFKKVCESWEFVDIPLACSPSLLGHVS
jgi:hypothetical protein